MVEAVKKYYLIFMYQKVVMKKKFLCIVLFSLFVFSSRVHATSFLQGLNFDEMRGMRVKSSKACLACLAMIGKCLVETMWHAHEILRSADPL